MKKVKLFIVMAVLSLLAAPCFAEGLGYINYEKVIANYDAAKTIAKELDAKGMELQQYLMDKEKEFKAIDTPVKKQAFKDKIANEYKAKEDAYIKYRVTKKYLQRYKMLQKLLCRNKNWMRLSTLKLYSAAV